jgi:hypothetical protein
VVFFIGFYDGCHETFSLFRTACCFAIKEDPAFLRLSILFYYVFGYLLCGAVWNAYDAYLLRGEVD